jgi:hypothetical protein
VKQSDTVVIVASSVIDISHEFSTGDKYTGGQLSVGFVDF